MASEFNKFPNLQRDWLGSTSIFETSILLYICFLSLVELERSLTEVVFFPSSTLMAAFHTKSLLGTV